MNNYQYLLTKLTEESLEVGKESLKTQQFGAHEICPGLSLTNQQRIHSELNDLAGIIEMLNEECDFGYTPDPEAVKAKKEKVKVYREYSRNLGQTQ